MFSVIPGESGSGVEGSEVDNGLENKPVEIHRVRLRDRTIES